MRLLRQGSRTRSRAPVTAVTARSGWVYWADRLTVLALRLCVIAVLCLLAWRVPAPIFDDWLPLKNVIVGVGTVLGIGKALFDTFFYDHYWP